MAVNEGCFTAGLVRPEPGHIKGVPLNPPGRKAKWIFRSTVFAAVSTIEGSLRPVRVCKLRTELDLHNAEIIFEGIAVR